LKLYGLVSFGHWIGAATLSFLPLDHRIASEKWVGNGGGYVMLGEAPEGTKKESVHS